MKNRLTRNVLHLALMLLAICFMSVVSHAADNVDGPAKPAQVEFKPSPEVLARVEQSQRLVETWYPLINSLLFDEGHALPYAEIGIVLMPGFGPELANVVAYVSGNTIYISAERVAIMPDNFQAMLVHEITHINQQYPPSKEQVGWLVEGIADYVRHKYFEKDISASLQINGQDQLTGYQPDAPYFYMLEKQGVSLKQQGYLKAYTVASSFLYWLEISKDKDIVKKLNRALSKGEYTPDLFVAVCGATLDSLWQEFVEASKATTMATAAAAKS
ncbi:basic secretory protein-like protein [Undibacterium sp. Di26W]|uniref:basic secretory protein-like protein n=1 Tax=Undibacterium sp. Di26W TaxID=3413035 RepID=UPI003BF1D241